jgi:hypothetical protein
VKKTHLHVIRVLQTWHIRIIYFLIYYQMFVNLSENFQNYCNLCHIHIYLNSSSILYSLLLFDVSCNISAKFKFQMFISVVVILSNIMLYIIFILILALNNTHSLTHSLYLVFFLFIGGNSLRCSNRIHMVMKA